MKSALLIILMFLPSSLWACSIVPSPYVDEYYYIKDYKFAESVVLANLVRTEFESRGGGHLISDWGIYTFEIVEVLKGNMSTRFLRFEMEHKVDRRSSCLGITSRFDSKQTNLLYVRKFPNGRYYLFPRWINSTTIEERVEVISRIKTGDIDIESVEPQDYLHYENTHMDESG